MRRFEKFVVGSHLAGNSESIHWYLFARVCVLFIALVGMVFMHIAKPFSIETSVSVYALLCAGFVVTFATALCLGRVSTGFLHASIQMGFDAVLISLWLRGSGTDGNAMVLFFIVQILTSALVFYKRGAWFSSLATMIAFALSGVGDGVALLTYGSLFLVIGTAGGYLAEELSRTTDTLRKKERTIERLTELHERILTELPTGLVTVDNELVINFANPAAAQILGIHLGHLVGHKLMEVAAELLPFFSNIEIESIDAREGKQDDLEAAATNSRNHKNVFIHSRNDRKRLGQRVEVGEGKRTKVLRGDVAQLGGAIEGSGLLKAHATEGKIVLFQDVTIVDSLEERLRQNEKLAAVGQLAAGIAHEIRNPLASMSASIEMLRESLPSSRANENQKLMDITIREIDRLNGLVTEFLDYVKPDRTKMGEIDLGSLIGDIVQEVKRRKDLSEGIVIVDRSEPRVVVQANREKIGQVLLNLMLNAIQAISLRGRIEVGCRLEGNKIVLWVEDDGCGMKEVVKQHLFEPFFTTKPKGTGLGLAIVYKIVEAHRGTISVKSQIGKGSRFEITLEVPA